MIIKEISTQNPGNEFTRNTENEFKTISKTGLHVLGIATQQEYDKKVLRYYDNNKDAKLLDYKVITN